MSVGAIPYATTIVNATIYIGSTEGNIFASSSWTGICPFPGPL
jgi:hypothetical protein